MSFDVDEEWDRAWESSRYSMGEALRMLVDAARADEREKAAQIADTYRGVGDAAAQIAAAIRCRGKTTA